MSMGRLRKQDRFKNSKNQDKLTPVCQMLHDGDVDRARMLPSDPFVLASRMGREVAIFKYVDLPIQPKDTETKATPLLRGVGHTEEGYGLDWNMRQPGLLLTCGKDGTFLWNVDMSTSGTFRPQSVFTTAVSDVCWNMHSDGGFATVSLEGEASVNSWDPRWVCMWVFMCVCVYD
jgi:histone-binding protein RBBP4